MPSSQSTLDKLLASLAGAGPISTRQMFGEYCVYLGPKVVGLVADDEFFLKPTAAGKRLAPKAVEKPAYPGAKPSLLIPKSKWKDRDWMCGLVTATADDLPMPKKKRLGKPQVDERHMISRDDVASERVMPNSLKNLLCGLVGGAIGCFIFSWFLKYGFYAMIAPGGLLGLGASFFRHRSKFLPVATGVLALLTGFGAEWLLNPWNDGSFNYFIQHLDRLSPVRWLMIFAGGALGFYLPFAQYRKAVLPDV